MKKKLISLTLLLLLAAGNILTVQAVDRVSDKNLQVSFNGKKMITNFDKNDLAKEVYSMEPGDSVTVTVRQQNKSADTTDWYLENEVVKSLEDSRKGISGGAYSYRLEYVSNSGQRTMIYDSDSVGGEKTSSAKGLHEATAAMEEDYIYLDRLASGKKGKILLTVAMEGESQANAYQDTQANLNMNFAVEKVDTTTGRTTTSSSDDGKEVVKTGDNNGIFIWSLVALLSGLVLLFAAIIRRRKEEGGR